MAQDTPPTEDLNLEDLETFNAREFAQALLA